MSETSDEEAEKKKDQQPSAEQSKSSESAPSDQTPKKPVARPRIGTPIGTPIGSPRPTSEPPPQASPSSVGQESSPPPPQVQKPVSPPAASRPSIGTPIGSPRPAVGTSVPRPLSTGTSSTGPALPASPTVPPKQRTETKEEVSRRNFLRGIAVVGGLIGLAQLGWMLPFLDGSVSTTPVGVKQVLLKPNGSPLKTSDILTTDGPAIKTPLTTEEAVNGGAWNTFTYPYTGNANVDSDTFKQCVIIRLPPSLTASDIGVQYAVKDPLMSTYTISGLGDTLVALSRVCVHLWCLWSYNPHFASTENGYTRRAQCPCHGSNYVPGYGSYPGFPAATNQTPGQAVAGPASLQTAPNNQLPLIKLEVDPDGTLYATNIIGAIGCGQKC